MLIQEEEEEEEEEEEGRKREKRIVLLWLEGKKNSSKEPSLFVLNEENITIKKLSLYRKKEEKKMEVEKEVLLSLFVHILRQYHFELFLQSSFSLPKDKEEVFSLSKRCCLKTISFKINLDEIPTFCFHSLIHFISWDLQAKTGLRLLMLERKKEEEEEEFVPLKQAFGFNVL